ncbi:MAG: alpha/beta fold hydrolase [Acidimicrobiia bacterium]
MAESIGGRALGIAAGVAAVGGAAVGLQRALVERAKRKPDPEAARDLVLRYDDAFDVPAHDGATLRVVTRGEGPTIVFSHGVTLSNKVWVNEFEALPAMGFRVVAYDHRGHGDSTCGDSHHSLENLALDAKHVLEAIDACEAVFVGHSMGGVAAQMLALEHPDVVRDRLAGIVLLSTIGRTPMARLPGGGELLNNLVSRGPGLGAFMRQPTLGYSLARIGFGKNAPARHVELVRRMIAECPADTSHEATAALFGLDIIERLDHIDVPVLVIGGTADVITPVPEARRLAEAIPGARLIEVASAGHMLMFECTELLLDLLVEFAREVGLKPQAA